MLLFFLSGSAAAYLVLLAGKAALAASYARRHPPPAPQEHFGDVTILQPILGGDPALAETLTANLRALAGAKFWWLLDAEDAAGWEAARAAGAAVPDARVEFITCPPPGAGENPKVAKLAFVESRVTTPALVVLDDDTRLTPAGLTALVDGLRAHDVVTGLPFYLAGRNVASKLVAQFVNNQSVLTYLPLLVLHPPLTLNGMAYALAPARWRALGGFAALTRRLTDDLAVARQIRQARGTIHQTTASHLIGTTVRDWRHYIAVMHRWFVFALLLVQEQPPRWRLVIFALHGLPPLLLWLVLLLAVALADLGGVIIAAAMVVLRSLLLIDVQRRHLGRAAHSPLLSLLAELLQPLHLLHALVSRRLQWRSRRILVRADDDFSLQ